jgi:Retroviral aspartyl protease
MRIEGEWLLCDDGITRPLVVIGVHAAGGSLVEDRFLIDSGADRTVLSADLLTRLALPASSAPAGHALAGVGGTQGHVLVQTALEISHDGGGTAIVRGEFAAFTDPAATDLSILGRDVLNLFDVILSRPSNDIQLLAAPHRYRVEAN